MRIDKFDNRMHQIKVNVAISYRAVNQENFKKRVYYFNQLSFRSKLFYISKYSYKIILTHIDRTFVYYLKVVKLLWNAENEE